MRLLHRHAKCLLSGRQNSAKSRRAGNFFKDGFYEALQRLVQGLAGDPEYGRAVKPITSFSPPNLVIATGVFENGEDYREGARANERLHLEIVNRREAKVIWMGKK